ncbi:MAG: hypothetical protein R3C32_08085 [Chloroflexota bacterium]
MIDGQPFQPAPLATSVVGSHARPGWLDLAVAGAARGELGPADIREVQDDAVDAALRDQEDAGIDIPSDGEMRRAGFFTAEFYLHITGVEPLPSERRLALAPRPAAPARWSPTPGRRMGWAWSTSSATPDLDTCAASRSPSRGRSRSGRLTYGAGEVPGPHRRRRGVRAHPRRRGAVGPAEAGAGYIRIDEPSPAIHPEASHQFATLSNAATADVQGRVRARRAICALATTSGGLAARAYRPVLEQALAFRVDDLVLEWANREMAELDVAGDIAAAGRRCSGSTPKSYHVESADEVAARSSALDAGVSPERLTLVPDCGFSQTARRQRSLALRWPRRGSRPGAGPRQPRADAWSARSRPSAPWRALGASSSGAPTSQLPTPTATAPASMSARALSAVTPPVGISGMSGNGPRSSRRSEGPRPRTLGTASIADAPAHAVSTSVGESAPGNTGTSCSAAHPDDVHVRDRHHQEGRAGIDGGRGARDVEHRACARPAR